MGDASPTQRDLLRRNRYLASASSRPWQSVQDGTRLRRAVDKELRERERRHHQAVLDALLPLEEVHHGGQ